jgi:kynureninase
LLADEGIGAALVHERVEALQELFLRQLTTPRLAREQLLLPGRRGNFLCWRTPNAAALHSRLLELGVVCDHRSDRLRLGFGLYHDPGDIEKMAELVNRVRL